MAYTKTVWSDEVPLAAVRYDVLEDGGTPIHEDVQINLATSVVAGTPVNAANLNNMETGIEDAHTHIANATVHVTNGNSHDHNGGDGAQINHTTLSNIGTNTHAQIDSHIAAAAPHSGHALVANGVTNGNSHDHNGGDGAQINHTTLSNIGTNTHAQIDSHIGSFTVHVTNGNSHDHVGGDGAAIGAGGLANGAVDTTARLANDIVDDTKVGNRVPQFYRRQGGDASNWATPGTSTVTPTYVREQGGSIEWSGSSAYQGTVDITFPTAFSNVPLVHITPNLDSASQYFVFHVGNRTASGFRLYWRTFSGTGVSNAYFTWKAVGPE